MARQKSLAFTTAHSLKTLRTTGTHTSSSSVGEITSLTAAGKILFIIASFDLLLLLLLAIVTAGCFLPATHSIIDVAKTIASVFVMNAKAWKDLSPKSVLPCLLCLQRELLLRQVILPQC